MAVLFDSLETHRQADRFPEKSSGHERQFTRQVCKMKFQIFNNLIRLVVAVVVFTGINCTTVCSVWAIQDNPFGGLRIVEPANAPQQDEKPGQSKEDEGEVTDTKSLTKKQTPVDNNFVRFHMWDGTIVAGEVEFDSISVKTEFGVLEVPIEKIRTLFPGLDSFPDLKSKINQFVEDLGNKEFDVREKAQRELMDMGLQIRNELDNYQDRGNAERKKRLAKIKTEINETLDEVDDEDIESRPMLRGDSVVTPEFAIVGKIQQETFTLNSKFGKLTIQLSDIKMAERSFVENRETIKKTVSVGAEKFFQRQTVSTKIRVNKGDRISIKADGSVQWTNWNTSSSPDGQANQATYEGIKSGTLCARIGTSGKIIKVGSKQDWTAAKSGVLYLAIAMQDNFLKNNTNYRWAGQYKAKVTVKPANQ